ncbi:MAG TPA: hypothetical protein VLO30_07830, partial [Chthoniobacterales bacterium]|nr:hypothetical protein [Chthoniobacterales bacterium]
MKLGAWSFPEVARLTPRATPPSDRPGWRAARGRSPFEVNGRAVVIETERDVVYEGGCLNPGKRSDPLERLFLEGAPFR